MRRRPFTVRTIALLGAASAAIHQFRYAIGYGDAAPHALSAHPHGYLALALPGIVTAALITLAALLMQFAGGNADARGRSDTPDQAETVGAPRRFAIHWLACALALAAIFGVQETLEGAGAFAGGGWIGLALSVPAGFVIALFQRGADAAEPLRITGMRMRATSIRARVIAAPDPQVLGERVDSSIGARGPPLPSVV